MSCKLLVMAKSTFRVSEQSSKQKCNQDLMREETKRNERSCGKKGAESENIQKIIAHSQSKREYLQFFYSQNEIYFLVFTHFSNLLVWVWRRRGNEWMKTIREKKNTKWWAQKWNKNTLYISLQPLTFVSYPFRRIPSSSGIISFEKCGWWGGWWFGLWMSDWLSYEDFTNIS